MTQPSWTEEDSRKFLDFADVAVPGRREQLDVLLSLIPAGGGDAFAAADLGCGEGILAAALLQRFPQCSLLGLDGSPAMLTRARERLAPFGDRVRVGEFDLAAEGWLAGLPSPLRCVVSSLAVHHLGNAAKRRLFGRLVERLEPDGALLIADPILPANDVVARSFVGTWDAAGRAQSFALTGSEALYERAVADGWRPQYDQPEPGEYPAPLFEQLKWLEQAGLSVVDCFWMRAGIAIFGGYR